MGRSTQEIYTILVRRIIRDFYPRETALPSERDIADEFEACRTVVRGVLKRLESEGYIEMISPRKRRISPAQPASVFNADSRLVGVIGANDFIPGPEEGQFISQRRIRGIYAQLNELGLSSFNLSVSWSPAMILDQLATYKVCGLVYANENHVLPLEMEKLIYGTLAGRLPVSTFGDTELIENSTVAGIERSASDHRTGPLLLLRYLAERGCRRALWYYPELDRAALVWQAERRTGYGEAAREVGIELLPLTGALPISNEVGSEENFRRYSRMIAGVLKPYIGEIDAILVDSDVAVPYFQRALRELGLQPGNIPVAGYDNYYATSTPFRWESTPPAATIDKNDRLIGGKAVELLLRRLQTGEEISDSFRDCIQPELILPLP